MGTRSDSDDFKEFEFQSERHGHGPCGLLNEYYIRICARSEEEANGILTEEHPEYKNRQITWQPPIPYRPIENSRGVSEQVSPRVLTDHLS